MRRDPREEQVGRALRSLHPPDEKAALERAVALAADEGSRRPIANRRTGRKLLGALLAAAAAAALVLTPAGADVREWMADAIDDDATVERQALTRVPSGGEVLVTSSQGAWLVAEDGSRRLLGDYQEATFSPRGLFIAAARDQTLTAVDPLGEPRWSISTSGAVSDARWAPSGYRIAYRTAGRRARLNVVNGDGTDPRLLARGVLATVPPSWRPSPAGTDPAFEPNILTYAESGGSIHSIDVDATPARELWVREPLRSPRSMVWAGPDRLVVSSARNVLVLDRRGRAVRSVPIPDGARVESVAASPDGERLAIVLRDASLGPDSRSRLYLARIAGGERRERTVFSGFGSFGDPVFSPNGDWILLPWLDTNQWLFIAPSEDRKLLRSVIAVGEIGRQFDPGGPGIAEAPAVEGWCCP